MCAPEIYPHGELAGVALEFDHVGKQAGLAGAAVTTRQFDADRVAVRAKRWFISGRTAARYKELICVGAAWSVAHPTLLLPTRRRRVAPVRTGS